MTARTLPEKILAVHDALGALPHAFGGALALAYYAEPRATIDIDLNVFVPPTQAAAVLGVLAPLGVHGSIELAPADGQVRLWWGNNPVDLFFSYDRLHDAAAKAVRTVPFAETAIPILSANHLVVFKTVYDRPKDWVDIEAMREADDDLDIAEILRWVGRICGDTDRRYDRIAAVLTVG